MITTHSFSKALFEQFREIGRDIFLRGLISSHSGNMSIRTGGSIHITRKGVMLGRLKQADIISLGLEDNDSSLVLEASSELSVHRAIYAITSALAIVHAHPPYATTLSMTDNEIIPIDFEGKYFFKNVSVIDLNAASGPDAASRVVSERLKDGRIVLVKGHGSFARGHTLEEAYMLTSSLESSCFFVYHTRGHRGDWCGSMKQNTE